MSPHEHDTRRRAAGRETLAASWDRYLDSRGPRAHGDLLKAADGHIRAEARRLLGRGHPHLEEVAQEALVGAARRIASGERPDQPVAYLRKIVHNKVVDLLRREARRQDRERQQWTPEVAAADASMSADWHDFLDTLRTIVSSDEFWTLILRYHFDYSYGEIGDLLDKEPNAIRQIAHRGRRKCREHLTRLEGRVPAWVLLPDAGPESGGRVADTTDGDQPGLREPRETDPADRSRRPPAGSESGPLPGVSPWPGPEDPDPGPATDARPASRGAGGSPRRRRLRPDGIGRPFGNPTTVVPLVVAIALPILFQVDRALDAAVEVSPALTAQVAEVDGRAEPPPAGPTISVTVSTAPTDHREAPSTSAPPVSTRPDPPASPPTSTAEVTGATTPGQATTIRVIDTTAVTTETSDPVTTPAPTTTPATVTTETPRSTGPETTIRRTTTRPPTTAVATTAASSLTSRATTTSTTAPTTTSTTTSTTVPTTPTTTAPPTTTTSTTARSTTTGRGPGDDDEPPPDE